MAEISRVQFAGCAGAELRTRALRLVAVVSCGPRIAFFGTRDGENLLAWTPRKHRRGRWDPMGGHRLWITRPGADECEETYRPDNDACEFAIARRGFIIKGAVDRETKIRRGFAVRALAADRVAVEHFALNTSDMLWSGGLWAVTCSAPRAGRAYSIPLGDGSAWDYTTLVAFQTWAGGRGGRGFEDPQFSFRRDRYVLEPSGRENKRLLKADPGILALHDVRSRLLFAKHAPYERAAAAAYPLGANVALYTSASVVEMETMGPGVTLKPGESVRHTEVWVLRTGQARPLSSAGLRRLFA